jgi:hypothetical protein
MEKACVRPSSAAAGAASAQSRPLRTPRAGLRILIRNHFRHTARAGSDFISGHAVRGAVDHATPARGPAELQSEYEAPWIPVLDALRASGQLGADVKLARLLMFGALNWSAQWYDRARGILDELADAASALFVGGPARQDKKRPPGSRGCHPGLDPGSMLARLGGCPRVVARGRLLESE